MPIYKATHAFSIDKVWLICGLNGFDQKRDITRTCKHGKVDLLVKTGNNLVPVEIKSSTTFTPEFLKNIGYFKAAAKERCPMEFLVYAGEQEQKIGSCHLINYKNIRKIFDRLQGIQGL